MLIAPPSRTNTASFGIARVASIMNRAGWIGADWVDASATNFAFQSACIFTQVSSSGGRARFEPFSPATSCGTMSRRSPTSGTSMCRFTPIACGSRST